MFLRNDDLNVLNSVAPVTAACGTLGIAQA